MKKVYIVKYNPNCEEDYIMFISENIENCKNYINKIMSKYDIEVNKYIYFDRLHCYRIITCYLDIDLDYM